MQPFVLIALVIVALAAGLTACAPLTAYNALVPVDRGANAAASDIAYGPHPRQRLDVYAPSGDDRGRPVVVVFYGGSWNSGSKRDYAFLGAALASRGLIAVIADYRLVPEVRFPAFLDDGALAVVWARQHARSFGGDAERLFLLGHSAGAYNAVMLALDARYLQKAGAPVSAIKGVVGLAGPYDFLPLDIDVTRAAFANAEDLALTQPINLVTSRAPRMLLATGAGDTTVYPRNSIRLAARLKESGVPATLRSYPGIGHIGILLALSLPFRGNAPVLDDIARFISMEPR